MKTAMKGHQDIYIKVKDFNNHNPSRKKKVIFKGKYCKTYLFEEDEVFLKTRHLHKKINPRKSLPKKKLISEKNPLQIYSSQKLKNPLVSDSKIPTKISLNNKQKSKISQNSSAFAKTIDTPQNLCGDQVFSLKKDSLINFIKNKNNLPFDIFNLEKKYGIGKIKYSPLLKREDDISKYDFKQLNNSKQLQIIKKRMRIAPDDNGEFDLKSFEKKDF